MGGGWCDLNHQLTQIDCVQYNMGVFMIKVENVKVYNLARAVYSARNPMNSWDRSDSDLEKDILGENDLDLARRLYRAGSEHRKFLRMIFASLDITAPLYWWKEADTYKIGTVSNSCSTMHTIHKKEFELDDFSHEHLIYDAEEFEIAEYFGFGAEQTLPPPYRLGVDSTFILHLTVKLLNAYRAKYLETKDKEYWWQLIQLLPSSYNQRRTITMNYENAVTMIRQRTGHKLDEWADFIEVLKNLPYLKEIMGE